MKKVLIIATIGGFISRFELNNIKLLQEKGYEVHYAANFKKRIYDFSEEELREKGICLHHVEISKNPFRFIRLWTSIKEVKELICKEKIELIHCHTPVGGVIGRVAGHLCEDRPYIIYTAHGFHFYKGAPMINWMLYYPVEYYLSKWTDCLVTINKEDYERAKTFPCKKVVRIPGTGVNTDKFFPKEKEIRENEDVFRIVSVGELNKNKNHQVVIQAIAKLREMNFTYEIYGNGSAKKQLEKLIHRHNLENKVYLKGFDSQIQNRLHNADCFIFSSIREGLGMSALEAMACGVAVIASDNRGTREYMRHNINGIVCKKNCASEYEKAIMQIYEDKGFRKNITKQALLTVQNFTQEACEQVMKRVYEEI